MRVLCRFLSLCQLTRRAASSSPPGQIVGCESINATGLFAPAVHGQLVVRHINALRKLPGLSGAKVIFVPESNSGFESQTYALGIIEHKVPHVYLMDEDTKHVGIRSTNSSKKRMAILLGHALRAHMVRFHPLLVVTTEQNTADDMRKLLIQQLGDFKRKVKIRRTSADNDGVPEYTEIYSGKHGGHRDDHALGTMINYIGHVIYMQKYEEVYRNKKPLWETPN